MMERKAFLQKPKHQCHLSQWGEWVYCAKSWKERRLICESVFVPIDKQSLILINGGNKSLLKETKMLMPFIKMWGISLWCPILKKKDITMWLHVCPNWQTNLNSKNGWMKSFSYETKASMSFISMRRMSLWCPILKRKEITMWILLCVIWRTKTLILKKMIEKKIFIRNQSINIVYDNEEKLGYP